jgi:hypothetical protein
MSENEPENLILCGLREIRADMRSMADDIRDVRRRAANPESSIAGVRSDIALLHTIAAQSSACTDDVIDRLERIEKRLGLVEA